ncbi:sulfatase-like hydrolase/transferase [Halorubrum ezzemoulense]|uniref:sulfatase-like hydrolase/transferase n=1 Tax=Halorubrum ezzemoulense TaxID=337243 RepID=UPI0015C64909|nr:sulfatase-like hydrolase/transferase [Halorubrum ezzemoulense]
MTKNIILLVWDACRTDYISNHAPTLTELADQGIFFENAISSATWSLPSHASLVTGVYPHEHGVTGVTDSLQTSPLLDTLSERGYTCYGFSPNSFASASHNFDLGFDHFEFTKYLARSDGINPAQYYRAFTDSKDGSVRSGLRIGSRVYQDLVASITDPEVRLTSSLVNFCVAVSYQTHEAVPGVSRLLPPLVKQAGIRPSEINTHKIESVIEAEADSEDPFFIFANYTDTHYPYIPPTEIQSEILSPPLDRAELIAINEEYAQEWEFMKKEIAGSGVPKPILEKVRRLYAGEVRSTDRHLARILSVLKSNGIADDTVIVVTADHGENLGESCVIDGPRMGHLATVSDRVTHVPLVVSAPDADETTVSKLVPLKNIRYLIESLAFGETGSTNLVEAIQPDESYVVCQATPNGVPEVYKRHAELPKELLRTEVTESRVVLYEDDWKIVTSTHRDPLAVRDDTVVPVDEAPEKTVQVAIEQAEILKNGGTTTDEAVQDRLQKLGYL